MSVIVQDIASSHSEHLYICIVRSHMFDGALFFFFFGKEAPSAARHRKQDAAAFKGCFLTLRGLLRGSQREICAIVAFL